MLVVCVWLLGFSVGVSWAWGGLFQFCHRRYGLISKFSVGYRYLLHQGLSEPEFCRVCKFKGIVGGAVFSVGFGGGKRSQRIGCGFGVVRRSACLVVGTVTVGGFAVLFGCTPVNRASVSMMAPTWSYSFWLVGARALSSVSWSTGAQLMIFFCFGFPALLFDRPGISICHVTRCVCRVLAFASS